jgi:2'-5' RNA ligase
VRLFFAAFLSRDNMRAYEAFVDHLIEQVPGVLRPIPPQTHHITLAFLGEVAENALTHLRSALDSLADLESFEYSLALPTLLLGRGRPRLLRVDITDNARRVSEIQSTLIIRVRDHLPSLDTRLKPPHATIARCQRNRNPSQAHLIAAALDRLHERSLPEGDTLTSVHLVKSSLTPAGPIYETVCQVALSAAAKEGTPQSSR